jgi:hypothetical protein
MTKELSISTTTKVREKLNLINQRLEKMQIAKDAGPRTNGIFHWNGRDQAVSQTGSVEIKKVTSIALLISILGFLLTRKDEYDKAAERLDLNPFPVFLWSKYPLDAWENDIKAQISLITHSSEIEKLTKLKDELSKYVSEEDRVTALLEQIGE